MSNPTTQSPKSRPAQRSRAGQTPRNAQRPGLKLSSTRRDAKPLIFGWGKSLTRIEREHYQRLAIWGFGALVSLSIVGIILFTILQQFIFIPNSAIVTVNATPITQEDYRKLLAYTAQDEWNAIQTSLKEYNDLTEKALAGDKGGKDRLAVLTSQLQVAKQSYQQSSITQHAINIAVEDRLIQRAVADIVKTHPDAKAQLEPSATEVDARVKAFKAAFPKGQSYSDFLSKNSMTESDVRTDATMYIRRDKMQAYLSNQFTKSIKQAHLRRIELGDRPAAEKILNQLKAQHLTDKGANWSEVAKVNSLDIDSKDKAGDMGFVAPGTNDSGIELWVFDASRKVGDLSIVQTAGGTFDIVQVLDYAQKDMTAEQLSAAKSNALDHWLSGQRVAPSTKVGKADTDALIATRNLPRTPDLNAQLPDFSPSPPQVG